MAAEDDDAETAVAVKPLLQDCASCQMIRTGLPFAMASYLVYHTYKNRLKLRGWERTKLYIVNGLFTTSKCFLSIFNCKFVFGIFATVTA